MIEKKEAVEPFLKRRIKKKQLTPFSTVFSTCVALVKHLSSLAIKGEEF
jgi:hypothetical protein